ncbi:hypothetical protein VNI00_005570 [Paramarasmius palmivorus]|uniref:Uncharacterized protein n=1 Tax=Paramarasmius palmivorus TaxID=297713 RepID=A0AAW0DG54_9AGAR
MAAFSRLQLAAALIEYDNDNPNAPHRSAHESAIFAPMRRSARPSATAMSRKSDHLGVSLPSETGSLNGHESTLDGRKSRGSIGLRNLFSDDRLEGEAEDEEEEVPDVDLTSWGLDAFMSKERTTKNAKGKAKSVPSTQPLSTVPSYLPHTDVIGGVGVIRRPKAGRSMSVGNYDFLTPVDNSKRRQSIGSPLDLAGLEVPAPFQRPSPTAYDEPIPAGSIPFPTTSVRSPSPDDDPTRRRTYSTASIDSKLLLNDGERRRAMSSGTMDTSRMLDEENPFAMRPPSRSSKFDPKAAVHARTMSNASFGSRMMLENDMDAESVMTGNRRYSSTLDLLRPKVLIMPSPLQSSTPPPPPPPKGRDGFQISTEPPLPPGARSTRGPIASNSFTPNPHNDLSLSQMTFRNHLAVDGRRDTSFGDGLPRALEDGQQARFDPDDDPASEAIPVIATDDSLPPARPAGKLYGKSLIDDLEMRKAQMKGRQRVFTGDDRPSMMKRGTLIDPSSLQRPTSQHFNSYNSTDLSRSNSGNAKPLLNFDEGDKLPSTSNQQLPPVRSVFGVDTLWQREMVKLKEIEAQEALERERMEREEAANPKKKKKGKKGKQTLEVESPAESSPVSRSDTPVHSESRAPVLPAIASSSGPPVLPAIKPVNRGPPPIIDDDASDSEQSVQNTPRRPAKVEEGWHSSSEDEEEGPRRTTGIGLRNPANKAGNTAPRLPAAGDDSEDEDIPLSMAAKRSVHQLKPTRDDDSDEEKPLSMLLDSARLKLPEVNFDRSQKGDDDDDAPLGLRASRVMPTGGEDDDVPLAFHPQQQMRTQQQMMMQQQQQQMMMQNSMAMNSMFFNPSMSGFFPPAPMMMQPMQPMVQAPIPLPSPPPAQDPVKHSRVDRWRHDVAIES